MLARPAAQAPLRPAPGAQHRPGPPGDRPDPRRARVPPSGPACTGTGSKGRGSVSRPLPAGSPRRLLATSTDHGLELIASAATHALLPLTEPYLSAARAQIRAGVDHHRRVFGRDPAGFWLPECGYSPEPRPFLLDAGHPLHLHRHPRPSPRRAPAQVRRVRPGLHPEGPRRVRPGRRDVETGLERRRKGTPATPTTASSTGTSGTTCPGSTLGPLPPLGRPGRHRAQVLPHHRARPTHKEPYDPERARAKAPRCTRATSSSTGAIKSGTSREHMDRKPIVVAPYDAELFGHWWFEGPWFLDEVVRQIHEVDHDVSAGHARATTSTSTPRTGRARSPPPPGAIRGTSKCGSKGRTTGSTATSTRPPSAWRSWRSDSPARPPLEARALNQAARELMLAQSSDWAFIMKTGTVVEYAVRRTQRAPAPFLYPGGPAGRRAGRRGLPRGTGGARQPAALRRLPRLPAPARPTRRPGRPVPGSSGPARPGFAQDRARGPPPAAVLLV